MKKTFLKLITAIFSFFLFFQPTQAQVQEGATVAKGEAVSDNSEDVALASTLLWNVTGDNIKDSYVYGTIHMIAESDFFLDDLTKQAFEKVEQVVLEIDLDDPSLQMEMMKKALMKDGQTLDQLISAEDYMLLDAKAKKTVGVGMETFNSWQPILTASVFLPSLVGEKSASYEMTFVQMAQQHQKEVLGLEMISDQINAMGSIPYEKQAEYLVQIIKEEEKGVKMFNDLVKEYKEKDLNGLLTLMRSQDEHGMLNSAMIEDRNKDWIPKIGEIAKDKRTFFAVGAGHLAGAEGVLNLLKNAGYVVTPVIER